MRSLLAALVLAVPVCAVAATPTYTNPMTTSHLAKQQTVFVTFVNHTSQEREVRIGDEQYTIRLNSQIHIAIPMGASVRVFSSQNSKVNGQEVMLVSAKDADSTVFLK
jgi:hypothetical protein